MSTETAEVKEIKKSEPLFSKKNKKLIHEGNVPLHLEKKFNRSRILNSNTKLN